MKIKTDEMTDETDDENRYTDFLMLASLQLILLVGIYSLLLIFIPNDTITKQKSHPRIKYIKEIRL